MLNQAIVRLPISVDLAPFLALLKHAEIPHRVTEEVGMQVLWVRDLDATQVRQWYTAFGQQELPLSILARPHSESTWSKVSSALAAAPITTLLLCITLCVALITWGGTYLVTVRWFSFLDFYAVGNGLLFKSLSSVLDAGQWWRLFSPMFLHFGMLHLSMNALWCWELGRRIETYQGSVALCGLVVVYGLASNLVQYFWAGPSLFGGLSGVLYGLLGHCWLHQRLAPNPAYVLPSGVVGLMLLWLFLGMTGFFAWVGLGAIANGAHLGGLLMGMLTGIASGAHARFRRKDD